MTRSRSALFAEAGLIGIAAVWGLTFVMVQDAIELLPPMTFLGYRFLFAALLVAIVSRKGLASLSRDGWKAGAVMGVFLTAGYIFQTMGLTLTTAANAGFITGLFVVLTPVFGALFMGQKAGAPMWIAALVSTLGLFLLSGAGEGDRLGDLLVLGCAASFAFHILFTDKGVKSHDLGGLLAVQLGVCGVFCFAVALVKGDLEIPSEGSVWLALAVTSVVASALGFYVQTYAQQHTPPARTALILASEPAFAGFFAYVLIGQTLTAVGWLGAALIMAAIVGVEMLPYLRPPRPLPEG